MTTVKDDIDAMMRGNIIGDKQLRLVLSDALTDVERYKEADLLRKADSYKPVIGYHGQIIDVGETLRNDVGNCLVRLAYADALQQYGFSTMISVQRHLATIECYRNLLRKDIDEIVYQSRYIGSGSEHLLMKTEWDPILMVYIVSAKVGDILSDRFVLCEKCRLLRRSSLALQMTDNVDGVKLIPDRRYYRKEIN